MIFGQPPAQALVSIFTQVPIWDSLLSYSLSVSRPSSHWKGKFPSSWFRASERITIWVHHGVRIDWSAINRAIDDQTLICRSTVNKVIDHQKVVNKLTVAFDRTYHNCKWAIAGVRSKFLLFHSIASESYHMAGVSSMTWSVFNILIWVRRDPGSITGFSRYLGSHHP